MKKILVPVDFSDHTETVCRYALEIACKTGGEIRLFHAYFDFMIISNSSFPYSVDTNEMYNQELMIRFRNEARDDMNKLEQRIKKELKEKKAENVQVVHTLTGGLPEEEILNISETYQPDLIIMGTRGKGEKDILTGKISSKVVQNAECRILTVPRQARYRGFENLLYATDFCDEDLLDLEKLIELLANYKPVIHCVHVNLESNCSPEKNKLQDLKDHFRSMEKSGKLVFQLIDQDDFLEGINCYVQQHAIDIIALVRHRKGFIKRLFSKDHTRELLFHSDIPLYIFPGRE